MGKIKRVLALLMSVICMMTFAGCTEGWTEPVETEADGETPITTLTGQKWGGKVTANIALYPDGSVEVESNGEEVEGTWEAGTGDVAMIVRFVIKDIDIEMEVIDEGDKYTAMYPVVADFQLIGYKNGQEPETTEGDAADDASTESESEEKASETSESEEPSYVSGTLILHFVADINEQLQGTFSAEPDVWEEALGTTGSYEATDSEDVLIAWTGSGSSKEMDFFADGTYEFRYPKMELSERGTWSYKDDVLTVVSEAGREMVVEKVE